MKTRILDFIERNSLSLMAFEKSIGVSNAYLRNTKNISADVCARILTTYPQLSADWLLLGIGPMYRENAIKIEDSNNTLNERILKLIDTIATLQEIIIEKNKIIANFEAKYNTNH